MKPLQPFLAALLLASGGSSSPSTLVSWSLDITAVPEPVNVALGILGGVCLVGLGVRSRPVRDRLHRWRLAFVQWVDGSRTTDLWLLSSGLISLLRLVTVAADACPAIALSRRRSSRR